MRLSAADDNVLSSASQPVLYPPHCSLTCATRSNFHKDAVGGGVKCLAGVKEHSIHCSPGIYPASYNIIEHYQVGQA